MKHAAQIIEHDCVHSVFCIQRCSAKKDDAMQTNVCNTNDMYIITNLAINLANISCAVNGTRWQTHLAQNSRHRSHLGHPKGTYVKNPLGHRRGTYFKKAVMALLHVTSPCWWGFMIGCPLHLT